MIWLSRSAPVIFGLIVFWVAIALAHAQEECPPPQGKGRVVVVDSGHSGSLYYRPAARQLAQLGYDVVLLDANEIRGPHLPISSGFEGHVGVALPGAIEQAQHMPRALPGKVALVGFSQGGGQGSPNSSAIVKGRQKWTL